MKARAVLAATAFSIAWPAAAQLLALQDRPLSAAERVRLTALEGRFAQISAQRSTSVAALRTIARALGSRLTALDPEQVLKIIDDRAQELTKARDHIRQMQGQLESLDSMKLAQTVSPLLSAARAAIDAGQLEEADRTLAQVADRFGQARTDLQARAASFGAQQADVLAQQAGVRASLSDFMGAAELWGRAGDLSDTARPRIAWGYRIDQARALAANGIEGQTNGVERSLDVLRVKALPLAPPLERPEDWAATQYRIGIAENALASRSVNTARNEAAVAALRISVGATTSATAPNDRVSRQVALASALSSLAVRTGAIVASDEAIAMMRKVEATERPDTAEFHSADAVVYGEHATILQARGETAKSIDALQASVTALEKCVARVDGATRSQSYMQTVFYLQSLGNIAYVYTLLAEYRHSAADATRAVDAAATGIASAQRARNPMLWAVLKMRHGQALILTNEFVSRTDEAKIAAGITDLTEAAEVLTKETMSAFYADIRTFAGKGLAQRARAHPSAEAFAAAIAAYRESAIFNTREAAPDAYADIRIEIAKLLGERGTSLTGDERDAAFDEAKRLHAEIAPAVAESRDPRLKAKFAAEMALLNKARKSAAR